MDKGFTGKITMLVSCLNNTNILAYAKIHPPHNKAKDWTVAGCGWLISLGVSSVSLVLFMVYLGGMLRFAQTWFNLFLISGGPIANAPPPLF